MMRNIQRKTQLLNMFEKKNVQTCQESEKTFSDKLANMLDIWCFQSCEQTENF